MGAHLALVVNQSEESMTVVESYLRYKRSIAESLGSTSQPSDVTEFTEYTIAQQYLPNELVVQEPLYRWMLEVVDTDRYRSLLEPELTTRPIYGEDIEAAIQLFRDAKSELDTSDEPGDRGYHLETGVIALCRFALENDYGVELSR